VCGDNLVRDRRRCEGDGHHVLAGDRTALLDGLGNLARLAQSQTDAALAVSDDDQRTEAEAPAAFHDLGRMVDVNHLLDQLAAITLIGGFGLTPATSAGAASTGAATLSPAMALGAGRGFGACLGGAWFSGSWLCWICHKCGDQNSRPASRAASARAFTLP